MAAHGPRLTPAELGRAAEVFGETQSWERAAEAIGSDRSTVRKALLRLGSPRESTRHARLVAEGLRRGRKRLSAVVVELGDQLLSELRAGSMEPKDSAALAKALATCVGTLRSLDARIDARKQSRLTRERTRVETERARAELARVQKGDGDGATLVLPAFLFNERVETDNDDNPTEGE